MSPEAHILESTYSKPSDQIGGTHYSSKAIQPIEYINANQLNYHQGNVIKYITRYKDKNGIEDLRKAIWYIEDLIKQEQLAYNA
jgi:hypothetical protein